ncbi:hypothetical protein EJ02DRAFT_433334 [Clathrospora elynae]|uniref:Uncharacterized protein n=1 Tax=Clathrospora elynae TaxID=706981 RepID=A0A6A5SU73_9PLEO|nr:hypothetical protein EJ02DRAFT_433334 [Clathrospora elynae]
MGRQNDPELSRLEELRLQRELKEMILDYTHTLYTAVHPSNNGFALLTCRHQSSSSSSSAPRADKKRGRDCSEEYIKIRAIVYTKPDKQEWKMVAESSKEHFGITPALQEFSKELERKMGDMTAMLGLREKRLFNEMEEGMLEDGERSKRRRG